MEDPPQVIVVMGSESDLPIAEAAVEVLEELEAPFALRVMSAHRCPEAVGELARGAEQAGARVLIAVAGGAAHLAGVIAAHTRLPVIGVPVPTDQTGGLDSLLSTVQMPSGVPVACMGLGKSGARNAAVLAVQILALGDARLREALRDYKAGLREKVQRQDQSVKQWLDERRRQ